MSDGGRRVFAGRGISLPTLGSIALVVLVAFGAGIGVGWGTGLVADRLAAPEPSVSPTPSASATPTIEVSIPPLDPIDRELDEADLQAGLTTLDVVREGDGSFATVTTDGEPSGGGASVRWVRVEYEEGLNADGTALGEFVLDTLNDPRGWGARGRFEFVPTGGAPDLRIVLASPYTAAATCRDAHATAPAGALVDASATPESAVDPSAAASADPDASAEVTSCADQGLVMLNHYDWMAGIDAYGDDRSGARAYLVNHFVGHALGDEDVECTSGRAQVMADQGELSDDCEPNPWPWPDEPVPDPSPSADATAATRDDA
ncbi:DUF3152 domain-containing protein [Demequina aestuarii]|uniref:DUF3152 domain-containing protein n=1 Tax=Demequina aestuarii TaxID=327095 RepID=UPI00187C6A83|nr:DUF3152 domain-containing protein [Demequina aestuarii]